MSAGYVGILSFELHFPESRSLKEKRMHLRSVKQQLGNRTGCSVAEVDYHDTWQRAHLTLACVTRQASEAERLLDEAERWLHGQPFELCARRRELIAPDQESSPAGHATLTLFCGLPGSGKTTASRALQERTRLVRLSPDDWLTLLGCELWDADARARVEAAQWELCKELLEAGVSVSLESGFWTRRERDLKRIEARALGARVELRFLDVPSDTLWRRLTTRHENGAWPARPITRQELREWESTFDAPSDAEMRLFDEPA